MSPMTTFPLSDTYAAPGPQASYPRARSAPFARVRLSDRERIELSLSAGRLLEDAGDLLGALRSLARLVAGRLGDACLVDLVSEGGPHLLAAAHVDGETVVELTTLRQENPPQPHDRAGVAEVLRSGRAELHTELPREAASLGAFADIGAVAAMVAPIRAPAPGRRV
jgi:hypothetical protein